MRVPSAGVPITAADILRGLVERDTRRLRDELARLLDISHVGLTGTGCAAFYLILRSLAARSDRTEVVLPAYTAPVVLLPVRQAGLRPVFADVSLDTFNLDPASAADRLGPGTLAVMPAHMFGIPCDLDELSRACKSAGAALVEDAASAFGAALTGRAVGTIGTAGFYSFHRGKQITSVTGGAWATDDTGLAEAIEAEATALDRPPLRRRAGLLARTLALSVVVRPRIYGLLNTLLEGYKDTAPHDDFDFHAYTALQAGVIRSMLGRLDAMIEARNARARRARAILDDTEGIVLPDVPEHAEPAFNHCPLLVPAELRDRCISAGRDTGVECTILYGTTVFGAYNLDGTSCGGDCRRAAELADRLVLIPCHPLVPMDKLEQAAEAIRNTVRRGTGQ